MENFLTNSLKNMIFYLENKVLPLFCGFWVIWFYRRQICPSYHLISLHKLPNFLASKSSRTTDKTHKFCFYVPFTWWNFDLSHTEIFFNNEIINYDSIWDYWCKSHLQNDFSVILPIIWDNNFPNDHIEKMTGSYRVNCCLR